MAVASKPCVVSLLRRVVPALVLQQRPAELAIGDRAGTAMQTKVGPFARPVPAA